jgi:hypothetical protein
MSRRISVRPSKTLSLLTALVGIGMIGCVVLFFFSPVLAIVAFVGVWLLTVLGIVGYHVMNAFSSDGASVAEVDIRDREPRGT